MITALLAIDVGGSTSRATLIDLDGNCLGQGRNRGGNPGSNPPDQAAAAVVAAAEAAVAEAGAPLDIKVAMLAAAGVRNADTLRLMEAGFRRLGLSGDMVMKGDTQAMLPSVTAATEGYCIFAGWMMAACVDVVFASKSALFLPALLEYFSLPFDVGTRKAKELMFESRFLSAGSGARSGRLGFWR